METQRIEYRTEREPFGRDHQGIVAGVCKQFKIIDGCLAMPGGRKESCGEAVQAMVLNALGLTGRALYLMAEYMRNKPVDLLIGEGLVAEDFNDDTLALTNKVRAALDEVQQAGVTEVFARVASKAVEVFEMETEESHLDASTFSFHGQYESEEAQRAVEVMDTRKSIGPT